ncbi:hypothetical protein BMF94_2080 [Rhodotorula taiwanensis]|uniref:RTR1-type domain-containing protein n=1 Tax=Rhodotorula taiwanensis TaxID=741276 RepID=A0A2S5BDG2_9BASI|nr:hypothetical protein BMF94_2080 [Rhodotorula taiwanensis]
MPSLPPPKQSGTSSSGVRPRPTSHFRVQTASSSTRSAQETLPDETPNDAALRDTTALLDRFTLSTLTRAAAATAPSTLGLKLALVERLASPVVTLSGQPSDPQVAPRAKRVVVHDERTDLIRQALRVLDPSDWDDLIDERWADGLCAFAGCGTGPSTSASSLSSRGCCKPREAYIPREDRTRRHPGGGIRNVRLVGGSLVQRAHSTSTAASHADSDTWSTTPGGAYCSERCRAQSEYYRSLAGRGREPEREEMWDEMEQRRRRVSDSTERIRRNGDDGSVVDELDPSEARTATPRIGEAAVGTATAPVSTRDGNSAPAAILSRISIHEKPLRTDVKPAAPTLADADRDLEAKQAQPPSKPRRLDPSSTSTSVVRQPLSLASAGPAGASVPAGQGAHGLPPIRFLTRPREVTSASASTGGSSLHLGGGVDEDDFAHGPVLEGIGEEEVSWLEEALRERELCERRLGAA